MPDTSAERLRHAKRRVSHAVTSHMGTDARVRVLRTFTYAISHQCREFHLDTLQRVPRNLTYKGVSNIIKWAAIYFSVKLESLTSARHFSEFFIF